MILPSGFNIGIPHQNAENNPRYYTTALHTLFSEFYTNWLFDRSGTGYFPTCWDMRWAKTRKNEILASRAAKTGRIWLGGNEPHSVHQSNTSVDEFIEAVEFWQAEIKLPLAIPGVLWSHEGFYWWEEYLAKGGPKPDAYHAHLYTSETDDWNYYLDAMLGYFSDRPLILSEFGSYPYSSLEYTDEVMGQAWNASMITKKVPATFYFSSHYSTWKPSYASTDCLDSSEVLTPVGELFNKWAEKEVETIFIPIVSG